MARERKERYGDKPQWRARYKTWVARVWNVGEPKGSWADLGTDNKELALAIYERWVETGVAPISKRGEEKFGVAAERVIDKREALKEDTPELASARRQRLRKYALPSLGHLDVGSIRPNHVSSLFEKMAERGSGTGTIRNMRSDVSAILAVLVREGTLDHNYARGVALPAGARLDTREKVSLTDEQILCFQEKRGFGTQLDMMALFSREVGGHRTSDEHAGMWEHVDLVDFAWMKVRRPKTDGEVGANARQGRHRTRIYELVTHELDERHRPIVRAWWEKQGRPRLGPIFPTLRDGPTGPVRNRAGEVLYVRKGSKAGGVKGRGNSYARALRRAVWKCEIYDPMPDKPWDPANPQKEFCRLQTDTDETRRLDFHSFRRCLATALADAGTNMQTALAILGHTQPTTQLRHYMNKRRVRVPAKALPGGAVAAPSLSPEVLAALDVLRTHLPASGTPVFPPSGKNHSIS